MRTSHQPNFLRTEQSSLRPLQAATLAALIGCVALTGALVRGNGNAQTATIADEIASPSPSSAPMFKSAPLPRAISESAAAGVAIGTEGDAIRYYEQATGKSFWIDLPTLQTHALSDQRLSGFLRSLWVPHNEQVISEFQKGSASQYRFFDYPTKESTTIGQGTVSDIAISPDGRTLAYLETDGNTSKLFVSATDGASPRMILETRAQDAQIAWQNNSSISLLSKRTDRPGTDLSVVDMEGNLSIILSGRENLEYRWSPDGTLVLFSYFTSNQGVSLWVTDARGLQDVPLGIASSAQKCAWHSDNRTITCGIPARTTLTRDVAADKTATLDDIATIDIGTGLRSDQYASSRDTLLGVIDPLLSSSQNYFVFTNLFDGRLYSLPLR
jgi:WD40 repeat protein